MTGRTHTWGIIAAVMIAATPCTQAAKVGGYVAYLDGNDWGDGTGAGVMVRFGSLDSVLSMDVRGSYVSFDHLSMIPLEVALRLRIPAGPLGAFAGVGAGYYYLNPDNGPSDDNVGAFPFVGLDVGLGNQTVLFGEVRWLYLETDIDSAIDAAKNIGSGDSDVNGLGLNVGLMFRF